ncbi:major capsid protein [Microcystis phage Mae-Yong1326-1]|nr:major capsid protein [Microcystis phage Mae-Yong1326-1]
MPFTAGELTNIANAALDFYFAKGDSFKQTIQAKPLVDIMERKAKTFPGGKGDISLAVKGAFGAGGVNDTLRGYTHDDTVNFFTPANIRRAAYTWREMHIGLTLTHTELKIDGLSVTDTNGAGTSSHSQREMHVLVGLLEDKLQDLGEQYARGLNALLWGDGVADAKAMAGIQALIVANPTTGIAGGINRATTTWWRNRARTAAHAAAGGTGAIVSSAANGGALVQVLQEEYRQLIRFGGKPDTILAGSDFIGAMEREMRANGYYSQSGFRGTQDASMGGMQFMGQPVIYDPTLDDLSLSRRAYWLDTSKIMLFKMQNEWRRQHTPARPPNQFVLYRSITCTGQMAAAQMNCHGVYDVA